MAITFQSKLDQQSATTVAFTVSANANPALVVSCMLRSGTTISMTYAGVSMTQIGTVGGDGSGTDVNYYFGLIGPATGTNNIVITHNGSLVRWTAAEYDGGGAFQHANTGSITGAAGLSVSVTPTSNGWIIGGMWAGAGTETIDGNTTLRTTLNSSAIIDSNAPKSSAYAIGISATGGAGAEIIACELAPASDPGNFFLLF